MILIEKDNAIETLHQWEQEYTWDEYDAKRFPSVVSPSDVIESLPTIEIVRCRECKHRFVDGENVRFNVCELNHNKVQADDWFCADGERRDEE